MPDSRQLQLLEGLCIQDEAPHCQAACPLHVDVRAMLKALSHGDLDTAGKVYARKVPLPRILSRICDQPCRAVCRRGEVGDALNIQLLERSCAEHVEFVSAASRTGPSPKDRVAVAGGGLSGMTAALELARGGYRVTLFEARESLACRLQVLPRGVLPSPCLEADTALLETAGVELRFNHRLGRDIAIPGLLHEYMAAYVAPGPDWGHIRGLRPLAAAADAITLATPSEGVFFGGSARRRDLAYSPVMSVADGRRAAISIDRFLKHEALAPNREKEGPYESRLYTKLKGVAPSRAVAVGGPGGGYSIDEAVAEADRCLQCRCLECVKACEYLAHFKEYPGGCIRKVTKNTISLPGASFRTFTKFINACSLCGLCGTVCPTGLDMAVVNSQARTIMWDKGYMPPAIHEFAVRDMEASADETTLIVRHQPGHDSSAYAFFPGCQLVASAPENVSRAYRYLADALSGGVGLVSGCCGAPAFWSGRQDLFEERNSTLIAEWESLGRPRLILACPTCSLTFQTHLPEIPTVSLWELLDREGPPTGTRPGGGQMLAVHDSCSARWNQQMQDCVRRLVEKLGYRVEELNYSRESTKCCGYGGLMYLVNREVTGRVIESRIAESPNDYLTYCSNCRDFFADQGKASHHLLDLVFGEHEAGVVRPGPTLSERRANRRRLAAAMLGGLWGESMPELPEYTTLKVRIPADVAAGMERDRILMEDVQQVIYRAEKSGRKLVVPDTGGFVGHYRPSLVTYWVEYAVDGDEYEVCNVYSHRMQIVNDPSDHEA